MRSAWIASALFAMLCTGGIATMLSQAPLAARARVPPASRDAALDPSREPLRRFGELIPLGLEDGVESRARTPSDPAKAGSSRTLRLR